MKRLKLLLMLILLISLSSCETIPQNPQILQVEQDPVEVDLEISFPYKPRLDIPEFPAYPQDMDWGWNLDLGKWILSDKDMDRLIAWRIEVESFPEKVGIVYDYYSE